MSTINKNESDLIELVTGKRILYVATTYLDYIRVQQELKLLNHHASHVDIIVAEHKSYFMRLMYVYWKLLIFRSKNIDLVFMGFAPQLILPFWHWKFRKNIIVSDFFISLFDTLVNDRKKFRATSWVGKLLLKLDQRTLNKSHQIVVDTKEHGQYFHEQLGASATKLMVLYLAADEKYYYPVKQVKEPEYQNKKVIFYFATVLPLQGVDFVIEAFSRIHGDDFHFIFIGPISDQQKALLKNQPNLTYHDWVTQEKLAQFISQADLCIAGHFNAEIEKAKRTIPGKAYIFEAMEKTILLGKNQANRERYPDCYADVMFVEMGSSQAITDAIINLVTYER